jgi:hypothetical protein
MDAVTVEMWEGLYNPLHLEHQIRKRSNTQSGTIRTVNPLNLEHFS